MELFNSSNMSYRVRRAAGQRPVRLAGSMIAMLTLAAATLTACGGDSGSDSGSTGGSGSQGGGMTVSVAEPADGATVSAPFTVKVNSSVALGPTESGKHHVHIWFDGKDDDYLVVESDTAQITKVTPGEHTMTVSLRNANHSAAGVETNTKVTVGAGGAPAGPTSEPAPAQSTDDDYNY